MVRCAGGFKVNIIFKDEQIYFFNAHTHTQSGDGRAERKKNIREERMNES